MTTPRVQSLESLYREMQAVARGEGSAPAHAAEPSVNSPDVVVRLLTPENRSLLATIRDRRPSSVAELASWTHRAAPNLARTLDKLAALGLVTYRSEGKRKVPQAVDRTFVIRIDPFSLAGDQLNVRPRQALARRPSAAKKARPATVLGRAGKGAGTSKPRPR